jgi:Domain of unknown function (DUF4342)
MVGTMILMGRRHPKRSVSEDRSRRHGEALTSEDRDEHGKPDDENERIRSMSEQPREVDHATEQDEHTCTKQTEIAASDLVDRTKKLIEEGNVRRLIIRNEEDEVLMEVPLTAGVGSRPNAGAAPEFRLRYPVRS